MTSGKQLVSRRLPSVKESSEIVIPENLKGKERVFAEGKCFQNTPLLKLKPKFSIEPVEAIGCVGRALPNHGLQLPGGAGWLAQLTRCSLMYGHAANAKAASDMAAAPKAQSADFSAARTTRSSRSSKTFVRAASTLASWSRSHSVAAATFRMSIRFVSTKARSWLTVLPGLVNQSSTSPIEPKRISISFRKATV